MGKREETGYKSPWGYLEAKAVDKNECRELTGGIQGGESGAVQE